jgi:hypothetical protein
LGGDQYNVLGHTGNHTDPCNSQLVSYPVSPIQVRFGDVLGAYIVSDWVGILFGLSGSPQFALQSEPAVGDTISETLRAYPPGLEVDESATVSTTSGLAAQFVMDAQHLAPGTALADKAAAIQTAINASPPQTATACTGITNLLGLVTSQTGKKLSTTNVTTLSTDAMNLKAALHCS